jgi:ATP-dependent Lhr-like helicase
MAWAALARGENVLLCSPTGSGKTLAAFAPILSQLIDEPAQGVRCLYLAPLKALANDIRRNLRRAIRGIERAAGLIPAVRDAHGGDQSRRSPRVRVGIRTGDTSDRLRKRLLSDPPEILATTPESLAILLTQPAALAILQNVRWVVVDEVHALVANKRGADLSLSLERLEALLAQCRLRQEDSGLQRIGLSATCAPLETAARFLVGARRSCSLAEVREHRPLELRIEPLPHVWPGQNQEKGSRGIEDSAPATRGSFLSYLLERLKPELEHNRTTLIFTNVRSLAERLTWALRRRYADWAEQIAVHHSSLSAARRRWVERRLKQGQLRVAVSSASLELGIDIGSVDGVILVHPPGGVVRLLQRIGRAGHRPERIRRGLVLTASAPALLEVVVTGASGQSAQLESLRVPKFPLDVLCQQLLGMAAQGWWSPDQAYTLVCRAHPYEDLDQQDFDACMDYLSGRRADGSRWLPSRLRWEGDEFTIADDRTLRLLRRNIGTIITEENRQVRLESPVAAGSSSRHKLAETASATADCHRGLELGNSPLIGEVDEMFADRLQPGDRFVLDGRCLEYRRPEGLELLVSEVMGRPRTPHWIGTGLPLSADLARRIYLFRIRAAEALRDGPGPFRQLLQMEYGLNQAGCDELEGMLNLQETVSEVPDLNSLLIECVQTAWTINYYLHTPLNRAGNEALARVTGLRLERADGLRVVALAANLGILLSVNGAVEIAAEKWRRLFTMEDFAADLERALEDSTLLREHFGRVAFTGLMLLRHPLGRRRRVGGRDWGSRRLYDQVIQADPNFVLVRQARREIGERCDVEAGKTFVEEMADRAICCRWLNRCSPLAECWAGGEW